MTFRTLLLLSALLSPLAVAQTPDDASLTQHLQEAQQLIQAADYRTALAQLEALESRYAGIARYDYWYGVAALRAGQASLAAMALERAVLTDPNHAGAQLELAAAFLALNRLDRAEQQLAIVEGFNPPPAARQAIADYRAIIAERRAQAAAGTHLVVLSLDGGYDSNYLNYPSSFDLFENTFLEGLAVLEADETLFTNLRGIWLFQKELDANQFIEASVAGQLRMNQETAAQAFDTGIMQGSFNYGIKINDSNTVRYGVDLGQVWLDGSQFRRHVGILVGWQYQWDLENTFNTNLRVRDFSFEEPRNDYRASQLEVEWVHALRSDLTLRARAAYDIERVQQWPWRQGGSASRNALSVQADYTVTPEQQWVGQLSYQNLRHFVPGFAVFNRGVDEDRDDHVMSMRVEWLYQLTSRWRTGASALYRDQRSSIDFFNLDQTLLQWTVTYVY